LKIERVVVFGHKPVSGRNSLGFRNKTHTHSYIHGGYVRGFEALGFETFWLDETSPGLEHLPTKGTLFFTEDQADDLIPLSKDAVYVTHSSSKNKYEEVGAKRLNLCNFVADLRNGISYNFPDNKVVSLDSTTFIDETAKALYQPWASNLLPHEISPDDAVPFDQTRKEINYVGTIGHDNIKSRFKKFKASAEQAGVKVKLFSGISDQEARSLVRQSRFTVDLRGDWHLQRGYIPCRIWKNLSYGMHVGSNSHLLKSIFQDRVTFDDDPSDLYFVTERAAMNRTRESALESMNWIKNNHTFLHRASRCISTIDQLF
jgi:hypothetical protein